jgi:protein gp37
MFNRNLVYHTHKFENPTTYPDRLEMPFHWKSPRRVFVDSMSDLFHPDVPFSYIAKVWDVMRNPMNSQHTFLVLTKRLKRLLEFSRQYLYIGFLEKNIFIGASIEDQFTADERIPLLLQVPAAIRFVSIEPMLGPVELRKIKGDHVNFNVLDKSRFDYGDDGFGVGAPMHEGIDWVICGGETGPGARPLHPDWVKSLRDQCVEAKVPFFFKQWGEWTSEYPQGISLAYRAQAFEYGQSFYHVGKKLSGRKLDGREWNQFPVVS